MDYILYADHNYLYYFYRSRGLNPNMKLTVVCDTTLGSLIEIDGRFRSAYFLNHQDDE
jgi:hypothetical protein